MSRCDHHSVARDHIHMGKSNGQAPQAAGRRRRAPCVRHQHQTQAPSGGSRSFIRSQRQCHPLMSDPDSRWTGVRRCVNRSSCDRRQLCGCGSGSSPPRPPRLAPATRHAGAALVGTLRRLLVTVNGLATQQTRHILARQRFEFQQAPWPRHAGLRASFSGWTWPALRPRESDGALPRR